MIRITTFRRIRKRVALPAQGTLIVLSALLTTAPAHAQPTIAPESPGVTMYVEDKEELRTKNYKERWVFHDVLGHDATGKPHLKPFVVPDADARAVTVLLDPGIGFSQQQIRDEFAAVLHRFPQACKANMELVLKLNPIEHIDVWVPNVTDNRRITIVAVNGCLQEMPQACRYCLCQDGGFDFTFGDLKQVLGECSDALHATIQGDAGPQ